MSEHNKMRFSFNGKGYYIALILCAAAIGISGYLYYRNTETTPAPVLGQTPAATEPDNVAVIATRPPHVREEPLETPTEPQKSPFRTAYPLSGALAADYAMDCLSYNETTRDWRVHNGLDLAADEGTPVCAAADGTVYTVYDDDAMGKTVVILHDLGYTTKYSSLSEDVAVSPGDRVTMGQAIGAVGETAVMECALGFHVHFTVLQNDVVSDPHAFLALG